jgi:hypothetical protein
MPCLMWKRNAFTMLPRCDGTYDVHVAERVCFDRIGIAFLMPLFLQCGFAFTLQQANALHLPSAMRRGSTSVLRAPG